MGILLTAVGFKNQGVVMRKALYIAICLLLLSGCTTVQYNASKKFVKKVDYPEVGKVVTVYVGDHMVQKGTVTEENVLVVRSSIDGAFYDIPAKTYTQIGYDNKQDFYSAEGVTRSGFADPIQALAVRYKSNSEICVITVYGVSECYNADFSLKKQISASGDSFQQTLIYSGRVGKKINIGYREFSNNTARPAFNNDVEYDLSTSSQIGYKGALVKVIKADNSSITYKLLRNFP